MHNMHNPLASQTPFHRLNLNLGTVLTTGVVAEATAVVVATLAVVVVVVPTTAVAPGLLAAGKLVFGTTVGELTALTLELAAAGS